MILSTDTYRGKGLGAVLYVCMHWGKEVNEHHNHSHVGEAGNNSNIYQDWSTKMTVIKATNYIMKQMPMLCFVCKWIFAINTGLCGVTAVF